jgi:hypothetical protein
MVCESFLWGLMDNRYIGDQGNLKEEILLTIFVIKLSFSKN